jgi:hypothetical protein
MRKSLAAALIAASAATSACGQTRAEGGGPTVTRNYQVGNFQEIDVGGPFDVTIRTGANPSVRATGSQKLIERLVVEVKGDKLEIRPRREKGWFGGWGGHHGKATLEVTVPMLRAATLAGAGGMSIDKITGDRFEGQIAGAGDLRVDSVEVGSLKLGIAGAGNAIARSGRAQRAEYEIAGSGDVDAKAISTEDLKVSVAGAGDVKAHATRAADVSIVGAGDVEVTGGAKCSIHRAGAGDVRCS